MYARDLLKNALAGNLPELRLPENPEPVRISKQSSAHHPVAGLEQYDVHAREDGKIILYHATSAKNASEILKDKVIHPPSKTGGQIWRLDHENSGPQMQKIYLATEKQVENVAKLMQYTLGGSVYIFETYVNEELLEPDEDSLASTWKDSIKFHNVGRSALGRTASYKGSIDDFIIHSKLDVDLSSDEREELEMRCIFDSEPAAQLLKEYASKIESLRNYEKHEFSNLPI